MKTIIDSSAEKGDEFTDSIKIQKSVAVHVQCRKNYTRRSTIAAVKRQHEEDQTGTTKISPPRTRARSRSDDNSKTFTARIGFENDLVTAEASYHHDCYVSFLNQLTGVETGRPRDEPLILAMEEIFAYIS
ncbi:unnamed protein product [Euphydryas editha]|uniref:Uncharacterized protein n=1 Tax=Euphydryas editha TaxID=104508 RepID=A0AAU9V2J2_EUPED|nr:unnamed protein product [Euphydryas editha]